MSSWIASLRISFDGQLFSFCQLWRTSVKIMMIVQSPKVWVTCTQTKWKITLASFWGQLSCTHTEWQPSQRVSPRESGILQVVISTIYNLQVHYMLQSTHSLRNTEQKPLSEQCRALWSWSHEVVLEKPLTLPPFYFPLPALHIQLLLPLIVVGPLYIVHNLNREYAG